MHFTEVMCSMNVLHTQVFELELLNEETSVCCLRFATQNNSV